jgi:hypothetical protein
MHARIILYVCLGMFAWLYLIAQEEQVCRGLDTAIYAQKTELMQTMTDRLINHRSK